jgi:DNA-binding transcriptional ArsR family regulator
MPENRPLLTDPDVLATLAHPVRLDILTYLMSNGPATASACARAVGDTPSNCSYHVRALGRHGLVEQVSSTDGRERPWRATITGFEMSPDPDPETPEGREAAGVLAASVALEQRRQREYLSHRDRVAPAWREADQWAAYSIRVTPAELKELAARLDALIRPLLAATRDDAPEDAEVVLVGLTAFPHLPSQ